MFLPLHPAIGYSIWLEVSQADKDLEKAIASVSLDHSLCPIPAPHCTVKYGVTHLSELEIKSLFREKIAPAAQGWPALVTKGSQVGVSFDGVDGEEMDMAWLEVTLKSCPKHEAFMDKVHACLYNEGCPEPQERQGSWQPHLSIAYDNPEDSVLDDICADKLFAKLPSLLSTRKRDVVAISLWRTEGRCVNFRLSYLCLTRALTFSQFVIFPLSSIGFGTGSAWIELSLAMPIDIRPYSRSPL